MNDRPAAASGTTPVCPTCGQHLPASRYEVVVQFSFEIEVEDRADAEVFARHVALDLAPEPEREAPGWKVISRADHDWLAEPVGLRNPKDGAHRSSTTD